MGQGEGAGRPVYIRLIIRAHTGAARRPPVALAMIGRWWSKPIHTAATASGVYPTNHVSAPSLVVPVLPAAGARKPESRTAVPAARVATASKASVMTEAD